MNFDFNKILNEKTLGFSITDDEDDSFIIKKSNKKKDTKAFTYTLLANNFKSVFPNFDPFDPAQAAIKEYTDKNTKHKHIVALIHQDDMSNNRKGHTFIYDYNYDTSEQTLGSLCTYKTHNWLNVNYPMVKLIENFSGPVYIGDVKTKVKYSNKRVFI